MHLFKNALQNIPYIKQSTLILKGTIKASQTYSIWRVTSITLLEIIYCFELTIWIVNNVYPDQLKKPTDLELHYLQCKYDENSTGKWFLILKGNSLDADSHSCEIRTVDAIKTRTLVSGQKCQDKQCRLRSDFWRSSLIRAFPVCYSDEHVVISNSGNENFTWEHKEKSIRIFRTSTLATKQFQRTSYISIIDWNLADT